MKTFLILLSFLFLTTSDILHEDTPLKIDNNGNIIGLPNEYSPAKFDTNKKILRIRNRILLFPKCITHYFDEHKNPKLNLSASWYHSKDIMPYYLNFSISDENSKYTYMIIVNLETLELIEVSKAFMEGNTYYSPEIKLEKECLTEHKNGIRITY